MAGAVTGWQAGQATSRHNTPPTSSTTAPLAIPDLKGMTRRQVLNAVKGTGLTVTFETDTRAHIRDAVGAGIVTGWNPRAIGARGPITPGTPLHVRLSPE